MKKTLSLIGMTALLLDSASASAATRWALNADIPRHLGHGHGRAGSTELTVRALLDQEDTTTIEITTGELDSTETAPGSFVLVFIRGLTQDGSVAWRYFDRPTDADGYLRYEVTGLQRGQPLQVMTIVRRANGRGVDLVTVTETVKLRPDPAVVGSGIPRQAFVGSAVNLVARVAELNGDVGATADCVLDIDGSEADRASAIYVPASDSVTCVFTQQFDSVGERNVSIHLENVTPSDWDETNNGASGTISVVNQAPFFWSADVGGFHCDRNFLHSEGWFEITDPDGAQDGSDWNYTDEQRPFDSLGAVFTGFSDTPLRAPYDVTLSQSSAGITLHSLEVDDLPADFIIDDVGLHAETAIVIDEATGLQFFVDSFELTDVFANTSITYIVTGTRYTFYSTGYQRYWMREPGGDQVEIGRDIHSDTQLDVGTVVDVWGPTYDFSVTVTDSQNGLQGEGSAQVQSADDSFNQPLTCEDIAITLPDGTSVAQHACSEVDRVCTAYFGSAAG